MRRWVVRGVMAVVAVVVLVMVFVSLNSTETPGTWLMVVAVVGFPVAGILAMVWSDRRRRRGDEDSTMPLRGRW